jgi:uncharacterized protein YbjT (DUF2867 family)
MRDHHKVDQEVRQGPAGWTLLKPHRFMQNLLRAADAVRRDRSVAAPTGDQHVPPVAASVAAAPLLCRASLDGEPRTRTSRGRVSGREG